MTCACGEGIPRDDDLRLARSRSALINEVSMETNLVVSDHSHVLWRVLHRSLHFHPGEVVQIPAPDSLEFLGKEQALRN